MKSFCYTVALSLVAFALHAQDDKPQTLDERISYAYGVVVASDLKNRGLPIDIKQFTKAFSAVMDDQELMMDPDEINLAFDQNQFRIDEQNAKGDDRKNLDAGKAFLAENAKKEGVQTTSRGLQYLVLKEGKGTKPQITDKVRVHYQGTLIDGTVFDSSIERGEPIDFALDRVIPGWTEGLQLMSPGAKYRLFVPYHMAYRDMAQGPKIKPYSALIFEVELIDIFESKPGLFGGKR